MPNHGITLLMSSLAHPENASGPSTDRQIGLIRELRRLYQCIPTSLANSSAILLNRHCHFDLVRAGSALFEINPIPGSTNPMLPVIQVRARILQVRGASSANNVSDRGREIRKARRIAFLSVGYADGFPWPSAPNAKLHAVVGHRRPLVGRPSLDLMPLTSPILPTPSGRGSAKWLP